MPELPEVETIVSDLNERLIDCKFMSFEVYNESSFKVGINNLKEIEGKRVLSVARRGKFIVINLENDTVITIHLRMTGRVLIKDKKDKPLPFERVKLIFNDCTLRFTDIRKFGRVWVSRRESYEAETGVFMLGVEPLSDHFTLKFFKDLIKNRKGNAKSLLLDQKIIAGVGNIYADEALFYAGIRPQRRVESFKKVEIEKLFEGIVKSLSSGVRNRGTSISDFEDGYGKKGKNQNFLNVYGRGGLKCLKCSSTLVKLKVAGRGTVYCLDCQK